MNMPKVNDEKNAGVQRTETRDPLRASPCKNGEHVFLSGGAVCRCEQMERKNLYCVSCGAWHKRTVKR